MPISLDQPLARLRERYDRSVIPRFFAWWWEELLGCLPARWRRELAQQPPVLRVTRQGGGWLLERRRGAQVEAVEELTAESDPMLQRAAVARVKESGEEPVRSVRLELPAARALLRRIQLPLAAESNLAGVIGFEMDKHTPFKADQVYSAWRVVRQDVASRQLVLDLAVVPKAVLDEELAALAALELSPSEVDLRRGDAAAGLNLLPAGRRQHAGNPTRRLNLILGVSAIALLFVMLNESVAARRAGLEVLRDAVAAQRQQAEHVEGLKRQVQEAVVAANFLADRKCIQAPTIEVLNELTNLLPDHTWLERMTFFGQQVQLQGQSQQANALIALLGQAKTVRDPQFQGVIQPDMSSGKERFSLQANLVVKESCE
jgi:general secretion pathway protein L